jgi:hypothetical protein
MYVEAIFDKFYRERSLAMHCDVASVLDKFRDVWQYNQHTGAWARLPVFFAVLL